MIYKETCTEIANDDVMFIGNFFVPLLYKTNRFHVAVRLFSNGMLHQNVVRTSVTRSPVAHTTFCSYHILTSYVIKIYY